MHHLADLLPGSTAHRSWGACCPTLLRLNHPKNINKSLFVADGCPNALQPLRIIARQPVAQLSSWHCTNQNHHRGNSLARVQPDTRLVLLDFAGQRQPRITVQSPTTVCATVVHAQAKCLDSKTATRILIERSHPSTAFLSRPFSPMYTS